MAKRDKTHRDTDVDTMVEEEASPIANATSPTSVKLAEVIDNHVDIYNADELSVLNASVVELQAYEASLVAPILGPPVNVDVPYASQVGNVLNCTMGNWQGEPTTYVYQWQIDGSDVPSDGMDLPVDPVYVGFVATCIVTAENADGSTAAPPSNPVTIA